MRTIISLAHISLDGFMAGPDGDFSFVKFDKALAHYAYSLIASADTSVYGRVTYQLMEATGPPRVTHRMQIRTRRVTRAGTRA